MWYEDGALVLGEFASYMVLFLLYLFFNLAWVFLGNDKMMEMGYEWGWARVTGVVLSLLLGIIGLIYVVLLPWKRRKKTKEEERQEIWKKFLEMQKEMEKDSKE